MSPRLRLRWSLAASLVAVPALMVATMYALGPRATCGAELNNDAIHGLWAFGTAAEATIAVAFVLIARASPLFEWRSTLSWAVAFGAAPCLFVGPIWGVIVFLICVVAGAGQALVDGRLLARPRLLFSFTPLIVLAAPAATVLLGLVPYRTHTTCVE